MASRRISRSPAERRFPELLGLHFRGREPTCDSDGRTREKSNLATDSWIELWFFDEAKGPVAVGTLGSVLHVGTARWVAQPTLPPEAVFWSRLESLCGQAYGGTLDDSPAVLHVLPCTPNEIRFAVHVGTDRSRMDVLTKRAARMAFRGVKYRRDGTLESDDAFGATSDTGSFAIQVFSTATAGAGASIRERRSQSRSRTRTRRAPACRSICSDTLPYRRHRGGKGRSRSPGPTLSCCRTTPPV